MAGIVITVAAGVLDLNPLPHIHDEFRFALDGEGVKYWVCISCMKSFRTMGTVADEAIVLFPELNEEVRCPQSGYCSTPRRIPLWRVIEHLNDIHLWSREEIADWLDTQSTGPESGKAS